jgi:hypothetical protein
LEKTNIAEQRRRLANWLCVIRVYVTGELSELPRENEGQSGFLSKYVFNADWLRRWFCPCDGRRQNPSDHEPGDNSHAQDDDHRGQRTRVKNQPSTSADMLNAEM